MVPARPYSSLIAASSARVAGGEPSYPTIRYRFAAGGGGGVIAAKALWFPVRRPGIRASAGRTGLVHPPWRTRPQPPPLRSLREIITSRGRPAARAVAVAVSCPSRAHPPAASGCFAAGRSAATGQGPGAG